MSPYEKAQKANSTYRECHHPITKNRFPRKIRQYVRDDTHPRKDRYIDFGVAKKPEQVLPEQRQTAAVSLYLIVDHEPRRQKETRTEITIKQQQNSGSE